MRNIAVAVISIISAFSISSIFWMDILKFMNSTAFGISDPLFNKDISFYVFRLPLINNMFALTLNALLVLVMVTRSVFSNTYGAKSADKR